MKTSMILWAVDTRVDTYSVPLIEQNTKPKHQRAARHVNEHRPWAPLFKFDYRSDGGRGCNFQVKGGIQVRELHFTSRGFPFRESVYDEPAYSR